MAFSYLNEDTIAAVATSIHSVSAIGIIRISGKDSWDISKKILKTKKMASTPRSHFFYRCSILDENNRMFEDGMFVYMQGPSSFTGENVVELHLHGNPLLLKKTMKLLISHGAREAMPGEFSFRAFKNGKISLDQAESINDLIDAKTVDSAVNAAGILAGRTKSGLAEIKNILVRKLAEVEVDIDFSDQGLSTLDYAQWSKDLAAWCEGVEKVRKEFLESEPLREGIRLAFVGAPNSGKSSLFNCILGEDRSIVSSEAGTTRDVVRESIFLGGMLVRLSDTAGIRKSNNEIESQGIDRSFGELANAHLVLWILDGDQENNLPPSDLLNRWGALKSRVLPGTKFLVIWNKCDLNPSPNQALTQAINALNVPWIEVSAKRSMGLDRLRSSIIEAFKGSNFSEESFWISRSRHFEVLGEATKAVRLAIEKIRKNEVFPDLLSSDLRKALSCLGEITGEFSNEDLLGHIFSEFCIGK